MASRKSSPKSKVTGAGGALLQPATNPEEVLGTGGVPNFKLYSDHASRTEPTFWFELHTAIRFSSQAELDAITAALAQPDDAKAQAAIMTGTIDAKVDRNKLTVLLLTALSMRTP